MDSSYASDAAGGLKTVERALMVLELVATASIPPTIKDVSQALHHNISSTYNIVNTLLRSGYLSKDAVGNLRIGTKVATLNTGLERANDQAKLLRPYVEHVNRYSDETVYLTRLVGKRVVIQTVLESTQSLRVTGLVVGFSGSEDRRASGKAVLAYLGSIDLIDTLRLSYPDLSDRQLARRASALAPQLAAVKTKRFAFDNGEFEEGICCIAAPYFGADGRVAGSIAASGPSVRAAALSGRIAAEVVETARQMSMQLGAPVNAS